MTEPSGQRDKPATLIEALSQLQGRLPKIHRGQKATVGAYSYSYAGLDTVTEALLPLLSELGLAWTCRPTVIAGSFVLAYQLVHESGEHIAGEYPLPTGGAPQAIGSAISYGRRYCLAAVTGAVTTDDDDGQAAGERPAATRPARARRAAVGTQDEAQRAVTEGQLKAIHAGFGELGYGGNDKRDKRLEVAAKLAGLPSLESTNALTYDQARLVLDGIARRRGQAQPAEVTG